MHHDQTRPLQPLHDEITVRHGVHRVLADRLEAEFLAQEFAVERVRVTGERGGSEREDGYARDELAEALEVG